MTNSIYRTMAVVIAAASACAGASAQDAATSSGDGGGRAVPRLFPIVTLFARRPTAAAAAAEQAAPITTAARSTSDGTDARFGSSPADAARIRAMDVAGVRLGMTPERARAALRASGYAPTPDRDMHVDGRPKVQRGYDYATRVRQEQGSRLSDGGPTRSAETIVGEDWNKGDEQVHVAFVPTRDAVLVEAVAYRIPVGRIAWDGIRSSVVARYGRPTRLSDALHSVRYCGDGGCNALGDRYAELSLGEGWRLDLNDGGAAGRLAQRQAAADADASIRQTAKPSF